MAPRLGRCKKEKKKKKIFIKHFIQSIVVMPLHTSPAFDPVHFNTAPSLVELCLSVFADVKHLFLVHADSNCVQTILVSIMSSQSSPLHEFKVTVKNI